MSTSAPWFGHTVWLFSVFSFSTAPAGIEPGIEPGSRPALTGAPAVDASTGLPAAPPVEKSFLQKYWLPIAGLVLFAVSQMGPDEPRRGGGAGAGAAGGR
ncbi:hypothetical protein EHS25_007079 [Saitozyma podzolica]|uniref:Uncharacterized protein n=1 Tax=Saitozyma podzolica TaxID=1890683 RepID=A0A427XPJ1_9TREE|nr:hypothetical protein EHS25_007079 [Saitozyma podzolica]